MMVAMMMMMMIIIITIKYVNVITQNNYPQQRQIKSKIHARNECIAGVTHFPEGAMAPDNTRESELGSRSGWDLPRTFQGRLECDKARLTTDNKPHVYRRQNIG